MRPDLFAGPALRDDRHRILARLANGGSVPAPARQWIRWDPPQRARLAAVATLLATAAAAWVWLQEREPAPGRPRELSANSAPSAAPASSIASPTAAPQQAATIVNAAMPQSELTATPPAMTSPAMASGPPLTAVKPTQLKPAHSRPATPRRQQAATAAAPESDEDVTLLAAMLKHAKPQKPSPSPPKD